MVKIVFMRHAQSQYNVDGIWAWKADCGLSLSGEIQSKNLGKFFKNEFDVVFCSPLKRAYQTLNNILPGITPIFDDRISAISIGIWENTKKDAYSNELQQKFREGLFIPTGGEQPEEVNLRVCSFVNDLFNTYNNNEKILVMTHDGIFRAIKRNYFIENQKLISNNLDTLILTNENYEYYKNMLLKTNI